jgi:transposase
MYRLRGKPLRVGTPGAHARVAVCGAYRYPDGPCSFAYGGKSVNSALFEVLLTKLLRQARRRQRTLWLVLDNGSAHTSKASLRLLKAARPWVEVVWLPTYSSEQLNDIENVWKHLKEDYFSRMLVPDVRSFDQAVVALLRRLESAGQLRRFLKPRSTQT